MDGDDHDVGAAWRTRVLLTTRMPGGGDVVDERLGADHERGALVRPAREHELQRGAARDDLVDARLEAEPPELAHAAPPARGGRRSSGTRCRLPGRAQRGDGLGRARDDAVAHPQAAVEVEQDVVVAREGGGSGTAAHYHRAPMRTPPAHARGPARLRAPRPGRRVRRRRAGRHEAAAHADARGHRRRAADAAARPRSSRGPRASQLTKPRERLQAGADVRGHGGHQLRRRSRSRWPPAARRAPAARSSTSPTRASTTARRSTASCPASSSRAATRRATGTGGPGYSVVEAPPQDLVYARGVVAMAKTELEQPGTSGSQFFIVTGEAPQLPPDYALVGEVTGGEDVVDRIGVLPVDGAARPSSRSSSSRSPSRRSSRIRRGSRPRARAAGACGPARRRSSPRRPSRARRGGTGRSAGRGWSRTPCRPRAPPSGRPIFAASPP